MASDRTESIVRNHERFTVTARIFGKAEINIARHAEATRVALNLRLGTDNPLLLYIDSRTRRGCCLCLVTTLRGAENISRILTMCKNAGP